MESGLSDRTMAGDTMIIAGIGLRQAATPEGLIAFIRQSGVGEDTTICVPEWLMAHHCVRKLRAEQWSVRLISAARLYGVPTLTQSTRVLARYGTGSIAEACALCGGAPSGQLKGPRRISPDNTATLAIAQIGGAA